MFLCYAFYPHKQYLDLITLLFQEKAVSIVTELINHNQPMFIPSSADLFEGTDINEYPVSWFGWNFLYFLLLYILCLIFAFAQASHGGSLPISLSFMKFAVGFKRCSPVCPVIR